MSFFRRISNAATAILPSLPSSNGVPASHVPRRATETFYRPELDQVQEDSEGTASRASWELSDNGSETSSYASSSGSSSSTSVRSSVDSERSCSSDSDSEFEVDGNPRDRFDMMTRHLWNVGERQGWFRDAEFDGLVSIR